ncbi:MAG TPA: hypothetical protein PLH58_05960 [Paludibacteraceae bacterium]|nr:hypothetical protein [Paludibacteraceae bacterium]
MKHNASMLNSDCPFFSNFPDGKENRFYNGLSEGNDILSQGYFLILSWKFSI